MFFEIVSWQISLNWCFQSNVGFERERAQTSEHCCMRVLRIGLPIFPMDWDPLNIVYHKTNRSYLRVGSSCVCITRAGLLHHQPPASRQAPPVGSRGLWGHTQRTIATTTKTVTHWELSSSLWNHLIPARVPAILSLSKWCTAALTTTLSVSPSSPPAAQSSPDRKSDFSQSSAPVLARMSQLGEGANITWHTERLQPLQLPGLRQHVPARIDTE